LRLSDTDGGHDVISRKSLRLGPFKSDRGKIWQEKSLRKYRPSRRLTESDFRFDISISIIWGHDVISRRKLLPSDKRHAASALRLYIQQLPPVGLPDLYSTFVFVFVETIKHWSSLLYSHPSSLL